MTRLKITADNKIPYLKGLLEPYADIQYISPEMFTPDAVRNSDALIIRTRTKCNADLLANSSVSYIATATIGFDHIDAEYCQAHNIEWDNAPGCNAGAVGQYVIASLITWCKEKNMQFSDIVLGIVGVGNVGETVNRYAQALGATTVLCDPVKDDLEQAGGCYTGKYKATLADICKCNVITFHTPLNKGGKYNTWHMANESFFKSLSHRPLIINSARGSITDTSALLNAYDNGIISGMIIDCWENEPDISKDLLKKSFISTPHIAGYSLQGKENATRMAVTNVCKQFGIDYTQIQFHKQSAILADSIAPDYSVENLIIGSYNPLTDSEQLRNAPREFESLRNLYNYRNQFNAYNIPNSCLENSELYKSLDFNIV